MKPEYSQKLEKILKLPPALQPVVFAAFLSRLFEKHRMKLTIVGGAAVQFYTEAEYVTGDLDAILEGSEKETIEEVMSSIDFVRTTTYRHFEHPEFPFFVEFPHSPIEVASRIISKVSEIKTEEGDVRIIRIEDLIMDRITAAVEWKDKPSLEQAKLIWFKNKDQIDRDYLTDFAKKEGYFKTLQEVMKL